MLVLILLGVASLIKVVWALNSSGTCDPMLFYFFGKAMQHRSMASLYMGGPVYNHTPLTGWVMHLLCNATHDYYPTFGSIIRIACTLADAVVVLALLQLSKATEKPPYWALAIFAVSPVSLMVSGFHGNIDPIMVMFLVLASIAAVKEKPMLCGLLFALACNVKVVPVLISPVFILYWMARGRTAAFRFMGVSGALMLAGASYGLIQCPAAFISNVFGYGSFWGGWGISYWLRATGIKAFGIMYFMNLTKEQNAVISILKLVMMGGVIVLAWRRRKLGGTEFFVTMAAAFSWIFVFMPGAGAQYMVWFAPFILVMSPRWWSVLTAGCTFFLWRYYYSTSGFEFPFYIALPKIPLDWYWGWSSNCAWLVFVAMLLGCWRNWFLVKSPVPAAEAPIAEPEAV
jgi:hypothetical protein